jgi:hypothetical protein
MKLKWPLLFSLALVCAHAQVLTRQYVVPLPNAGIMLYDGFHVWTANGNELTALKATNLSTAGGTDFGAPVISIAWDSAHTLWVSTAADVVCKSSIAAALAGELGICYSVSGTPGPMAIDTVNGNIWIVNLTTGLVDIYTLDKFALLGSLPPNDGNPATSVFYVSGALNGAVGPGMFVSTSYTVDNFNFANVLFFCTQTKSWGWQSTWDQFLTIGYPAIFAWNEHLALLQIGEGTGETVEEVSVIGDGAFFPFYPPGDAWQNQYGLSAGPTLALAVTGDDALTAQLVGPGVCCNPEAPAQLWVYWALDLPQTGTTAGIPLRGAENMIFAGDFIVVSTPGASGTVQAISYR